LRCTDVDDLSMALLGTGFGYSGGARDPGDAVGAAAAGGPRRASIGSAALDLCMVAAGRLDAYYEHGLQVWDSAAGALIAAEAGARVVLPAQNGPAGGAGLVVAAAPGIADELLAALERFNGLGPSGTDPAGSAAAGVNLGHQDWIDGPVEPGRRLARTASMSSLCASVVKSVPTARSTESSARLSLKSSAHGVTNHTAAALACPAVPKRIWPCSSAGAGIERVVSRRRRCEPQVFHRAGDFGRLSTSAAGVENADLGGAEFGG